MGDALTMQQIADLAHVERPVVSMWRTRYAQSDDPFPASSCSDSTVFDANEVAMWLTRNGRGNNPEAEVDAALYSSRFSAVLNRVDEAASLLLLEAVTGELLTEIDLDDVLDVITESKSALGVDLFLPGEEMLATLSDDEFVADIDALVEAGYSGERVLWRMASALQSRSAASSFENALLTAHGVALFTAVLDSLTSERRVVLHGDGALSLVTQAVGSDSATGIDVLDAGLHFVDSQSSAAVSDAESVQLTDSGPSGNTASRQVILSALAASGVEVRLGEPEESEDSGAQSLRILMDPAVTTDDASIFFAQVQDLSRNLNPGDVGIVIGPADLLIEDVTQWPEVSVARRSCLNVDEAMRAVARRRQAERPGVARDYCLPLRYVAMLPKGLLHSAGRKRLALWVLALNANEPMKSFTTYGAHANHALDTGECQALGADVAASTTGERLSHAFLRSRHQVTMNLLNQPTLIIAPQQQEPREGGEVLAEVWEHAQKVSESFAKDIDISSRDLVALPAPRPWSEIVTTWARLRSGHRIPASMMSATQGALVDVITPDVVRGRRTLGAQRVERLELERSVPQVKFTEPGDVVFVNVGDEPAAMVDERGGRVVQSPARVLRPHQESRDGMRLAAAQAALDINAQRSADTAGWHVHLTPAEQIDAVQFLTATVGARRRSLQEQLAALETYESTVLTGVAQGVLHVQVSQPSGTMYDMQEKAVSHGGVL